MTTSLFRMCTKFSLLRPLCDIIKSNNVRKYNFHSLFLTCTQCRHYHTTLQYFKSTSKKPNVFPQIKPKKRLPVVDVWNQMTVSELAASAGRDINDVMDAISFSDSSRRYNRNTIVEDPNILYNAVRKLGAKFKVISRSDKIEKNTQNCNVVKRPPPDESVLIKRRPVVTIMGHVDHGKTTLLDTLRNTSVVKMEFGGITQHIGAFNVTLKTGETITFLDTPGHAAFNIMRMRGAQVTDIIVIVVAADDGVMEQTIESINMANAVNVPIIVAINKIDKPEADIIRTQKMLAQQGIQVEAMGGDIQSVNISALHGTNLDTLIEAIALQAELVGLKGDPTGLVEAVVIECFTDRHRGKLATALIQRGTLRKGAYLVSGLTWAKVRAMFDHSGNPVTEAKLSDAVQIIGWKDLPTAGDEILEVENEKKARTVMRYREAEKGAQLAQEHKIAADKKHEEYLKEYKEHLAKRRARGRYAKLLTPVKNERPDDEKPKLNIVIKGDVAGSVEAILDVFNTYGSDDKCELNVIHYGVGPVTETDLQMADMFNAIIYPFNVGVMKNLQQEVNEKKISIRPYNVIYKLIDDVKNEINSKLPPVDTEEMIGEANVLQEFEITDKKKKVKVAGCRCTKGNLKKNAMYRLMREQEVLFTGKLVSMRHMKNETETIKTNVECGLRFEDPTLSFKTGDILICYQTYQKPQETDWDPGF
ncbi:PREDICTED: translation initiation factor IF-2, mitochondrial [Acromyrmex echinatior]|uniref:Translation initiation factor IF-2, mitochondrial n=1 Tax=Acromyrmex echinatior TaxID=103372 RepID=F4W750_ACREC|nr:PREDICTED: translation initiation factor IF-2, mitochondrial [Acromyrmex echinatior]XP_011065741.1 PREDICTED: translation initiation factor IF-2, mitochondrial [Acromyrmex echinatior]EGI69934.1 Translation initiation factor IF-2, mitochondrial [Acromyrmex echinatior]